MQDRRWVVSVLLSVGVLSAACGSDTAGTTVRPLPDCSEPAALVSALEPEIAYDYDPVFGVADLVDRADVTFRAGTVSEAQLVGEWLVFSIADVEVLHDARPAGSPPPGSFSHAVGSQYPFSPQPGTFEGAELLVAAHASSEAPDGLAVSIEGFFLACADGAARSVVFAPSGEGWPAERTIPSLTAAVRAAVGSPDPTWEDSTLDCYGELAEASELEPLMGGDVPGFGTLEEAADQWWTNDDGRFRADREQYVAVMEEQAVRYDDTFGNTQVIITMTRTGSGGWVAAQTEACFYG